MRAAGGGNVSRRVVAAATAALLAASVTVAVTRSTRDDEMALTDRPDLAACLIGAVAIERSTVYAPPLVVAENLSAPARAHAAAMAQRGDLYHSNLRIYPYAMAGENVATHAPPLCEVVAQRLNASPEHRRNTVDARWRFVGAGVVVADQTMWAVVAFGAPVSPTAFLPTTPTATVPLPVPPITAPRPTCACTP